MNIVNFGLIKQSMNIERERERVSFLKLNLFLFYRSRLLKYCRIVLLKSVGASTENNTINHIYYAEKHANKHSFANKHWWI
jgi:hypothetical protein